MISSLFHILSHIVSKQEGSLWQDNSEFWIFFKSMGVFTNEYIYKHPLETIFFRAGDKQQTDFSGYILARKVNAGVSIKGTFSYKPLQRKIARQILTQTTL